LTSLNFSPLESVLRGGAVGIHFQPILCLKQGRVVGLEALARPEAMDISQAFAAARELGCQLELDRLCRQRALDLFASLEPRGSGLPAASGPSWRPLLFLNFEASVIDAGVGGSGAILQATRAAGLEPQDVVIEINESRVQDDQALIRMVEQHRSHGFLIALDDLGAGDSKLARIAQLRPHILKLDRSLITGIERDFFKQETVRCLARLGRGIGALVLAEGVETLEEMDCCASLGTELFQGYVLGRPAPAERLALDRSAPLLQGVAQRLRDQAVAGLRQRQIAGQRLGALAQQGGRDLMGRPPVQFDAVLAALVEQDPSVEAAYLLDSQGIQVGGTHLGAIRQQVPNRLFAPSHQGADHSTKEYFFSLLDTGLRRYTTDSYISMATGRLCRTIALRLEHQSGATYVLCLDIACGAEGGSARLRR
jgi:EAL domain-containing protein (putative c-di-GMP-specific phosphodiesterase class I)